MVAILNYGMGNLQSVANALKYLEIPCCIMSNPDELSDADRIILPGVGSFPRAMRNLRDMGFVEALAREVREKGKPVLGICLGMQLLGLAGDEDGGAQGLGYIDAHVPRFQVDPSDHPDLKIPHVGFNTVKFKGDSPLFTGLGEAADFYFIHSYRMTCVDRDWVTGTCWHGEPFTAAVQRGNVYGTQFHPEKSQSNGLKVLKNFVRRCR
jgi:glutamine amidotransferase